MWVIRTCIQALGRVLGLLLLKVFFRYSSSEAKIVVQQVLRPCSPFEGSLEHKRQTEYPNTFKASAYITPVVIPEAKMSHRVHEISGINRCTLSECEHGKINIC